MPIPESRPPLARYCVPLGPGCTATLIIEGNAPIGPEHFEALEQYLELVRLANGAGDESQTD